MFRDSFLEKEKSTCLYRIHRYSDDLVPLNVRLARKFNKRNLPYMQVSLPEFSKIILKAHADIGLITMAPKGSVAGLQARLLNSPEKGWINVEAVSWKFPR